jgi:SMC interacting uncharacterized protein involved in chromosome segregation
LDDLQKAAKGFRNPADHCLETDPFVYIVLDNLSDCLNNLYDETHEEEVLIESIQAMEKAVEPLDDDHPRYSEYLDQLNELRQKHRLIGSDASSGAEELESAALL